VSTDADWFKPDWPLSERVCVITTSRAPGTGHDRYGGFNLATHVGDSAETVAINRHKLQELTGVSQIQWLEQVHGIEVVSADSASALTVPVADAAWTRSRGLGLAVLTADCLPVVIAAADDSVVAVVHAGWRGLLAGVLERTYQQLPVTAGGYLAWIGPAISASAYEVGEDVAECVRAFSLAAGSAGPDDAEPGWLRAGRIAGKYQLDLAALAGAQLLALGVKTVFYSEVCSTGSALTYSYRRDGVTGRMATVAWLPL
jgi:YfiH family protein